MVIIKQSKAKKKKETVDNFYITDFTGAKFMNRYISAGGPKSVTQYPATAAGHDDLCEQRAG